jgi:hypothetical protein
MIFFSSSGDFIPWNSVVAENMYLLRCSIHFPPFMEQESSLLCPEGSVTAIYLEPVLSILQQDPV